MRRLTGGEYSALMKMAGMLAGENRTRLELDIKSAYVEDESEDGASISMGLDGYVRPPYCGQHQYPVEGIVKDIDGAEMEVILYADHQDRLLELELLNWGARSNCVADWESFQIRY